MPPTGPAPLHDHLPWLPLLWIFECCKRGMKACFYSAFCTALFGSQFATPQSKLQPTTEPEGPLPLRSGIPAPSEWRITSRPPHFLFFGCLPRFRLHLHDFERCPRTSCVCVALRLAPALPSPRQVLVKGGQLPAGPLQLLVSLSLVRSLSAFRPSEVPAPLGLPVKRHSERVPSYGRACACVRMHRKLDFFDHS